MAVHPRGTWSCRATRPSDPLHCRGPKHAKWTVTAGVSKHVDRHPHTNFNPVRFEIIITVTSLHSQFSCKSILIICHLKSVCCMMYWRTVGHFYENFEILSLSTVAAIAESTGNEKLLRNGVFFSSQLKQETDRARRSTLRSAYPDGEVPRGAVDVTGRREGLGDVLEGDGGDAHDAGQLEDDVAGGAAERPALAGVHARLGTQHKVQHWPGCMPGWGHNTGLQHWPGCMPGWGHNTRLQHWPGCMPGWGHNTRLQHWTQHRVQYWPGCMPGWGHNTSYSTGRGACPAGDTTQGYSTGRGACPAGDTTQGYSTGRGACPAGDTTQGTALDGVHARLGTQHKVQHWPGCMPGWGHNIRYGTGRGACPAWDTTQGYSTGRGACPAGDTTQATALAGVHARLGTQHRATALAGVHARLGTQHKATALAGVHAQLGTQHKVQHWTQHRATALAGVHARLGTQHKV